MDVKKISQAQLRAGYTASPSVENNQIGNGSNRITTQPQVTGQELAALKGQTPRLERERADDAVSGITITSGSSGLRSVAATASPSEEPPLGENTGRRLNTVA